MTVVENDKPGRKLFEKSGYVSEGIRQDSMVINGKYYDEIYMAKFLDEKIVHLLNWSCTIYLCPDKPARREIHSCPTILSLPRRKTRKNPKMKRMLKNSKTPIKSRAKSGIQK